MLCNCLTDGCKKTMSTKILFWVFVFLGVVLEIVGDVFFKKWVTENRAMLFLVGFVVYAIGTLFWASSLKYEMLSKAISVFTILNLIAVVLVGVIFFKENISVVSKLGILLGVVSIFLIELG